MAYEVPIVSSKYANEAYDLVIYASRAKERKLIFMKKNICFTIPGEKSKNGIVKVVTNIANALQNTNKYNISILPVAPAKKSILKLNNNIKLIQLGLNEKINKVTLHIQLIAKLIKLFKNYKPDIIVVSGTEYVLPITIGTSVLKLTKLFVWEHLNFSAGPRFRLEWFGKRYALKHWNGVLCITKRDYVQYSEFKKKKNNIYQIYNLTDFSTPRRQYDVKSKKIISCGYLSQIKGFDMLMAVAKGIFDKYPDWSWDIYGEGSERDNLEKLIQDYHLEKFVFLKGYHKNINELYKNYSFFVLTSRAEGMGMVLIEAQKSGLPVISFDIKCGPSDVISHGENGYLVKPFNIREMQYYITKFIDNPKLRKKFSDRSEMNLDEFKKEFILLKWESLLDK